MKRIVVVVALAAVLVGLVGASLAAAPSPRQSPTKNENGAFVENDPLHTFVESECVGEVVEITGTLHLVGQSHPVQGGHHIIFHLNFANMKGVGLTTGDEYVVIGNSQQVENFVPSGQTVAGTVIINLVIGKGQTPNRDAVLQQHYIITPEGEVKMQTDQFHLKCQGGSTASPTASASASASAPATAP